MKLPLVLVQEALVSQSLLLVSHSFTSSQTPLLLRYPFRQLPHSTPSWVMLHKRYMPQSPLFSRHSSTTQACAMRIVPSGQVARHSYSPGRFTQTCWAGQGWLRHSLTSIQTSPVPPYPGLHRQEKPGVSSTQVAMSSQLSRPSAHSSMFTHSLSSL